jgi:hypothetical protein
MKYLSIYRFVKHYISSILGKLEGFLITPLVFPHRDWIRNYAWNYMRVNGLVSAVKAGVSILGFVEGTATTIKGIELAKGAQEIASLASNV